MDAESISPLSDSIGIVDPNIAALRRITTEQLLELGRRQIAYLRTGLRDGALIFILYGADGAPIVMVESIERAAKAAMHLSLELIAVH